MKKKIIPILPGLILSFVIAFISKQVIFLLPKLGAARLAILIGILLGNTFFKQEVLQKGTRFAESRLLEWAIVLLGMTVTIQTITHIGWNGVLFILLQMVGTIIGVYWIGKKMYFSKTMTLLMAGGNAICGSSAIAAIAPVIDADDQEKGQIVTLVNLLGTVLMLTLPIVALGIYPNQFLSQSALVGGTLQSVGQVIASSQMISPTVTEYATLFKILRILFLVPIVFLFGKLSQSNFAKTNHFQQPQPKKKKSLLPWYITGFVILCIINSLFSLPTIVSHSTHLVSNWFEITALAAIGLRLDLSRFLQEGKRFLLFAFLVGCLQVVLAIGLIQFIGIR